jgi:hypothetical protein
LKLADEINRNIEAARKEAQLASMEKVTVLEAALQRVTEETHRWRKAYEELKSHHNDERRADVCNLVRAERERDDARKDLDQARIERGHYRRMLFQEREAFKVTLKEQSKMYNAQIQKLMNHIVLMTGGPVVIELPPGAANKIILESKEAFRKQDCGCIRGTVECKHHPTKQECMDRYINTLPADYEDWVRKGDIQRHAPSC